ncbi:hypothetical protein Tco_0246270 [Tanacetum coccineum]
MSMQKMSKYIILPPSTSGNDLDNVTFYIVLHIDGETTEVGRTRQISLMFLAKTMKLAMMKNPPVPHDLADSDVEDLINDDDGVEKMADVARAHGGDGGGEDPSLPPPQSFFAAVLLQSPRVRISGLLKRKAKAQFGRRESRQEDPGKDPEPRCPGFLKPLVLAVFVLRSQELHNPQLHLGIPIS